MPVCTKCKHNREIERLRNVCAACRGSSSLQSTGKQDGFDGLVRIDAAADPMLVLREIDNDVLANSRLPRNSRVNLDNPDLLELLLHIVAEFGNVTDLQAPVLIRKMRGQTNMEIAEEMGISQALVWNRWDNIKRHNPTLAVLENGLQGKRGGGAHTHKPTKADGDNGEDREDGKQAT